MATITDKQLNYLLTFNLGELESKVRNLDKHEASAFIICVKSLFDRKNGSKKTTETKSIRVNDSKREKLIVSMLKKCTREQLKFGLIEGDYQTWTDSSWAIAFKGSDQLANVPMENGTYERPQVLKLLDNYVVESEHKLDVAQAIETIKEHEVVKINGYALDSKKLKNVLTMLKSSTLKYIVPKDNRVIGCVIVNENGSKAIMCRLIGNNSNAPTYEIKDNKLVLVEEKLTKEEENFLKECETKDTFAIVSTKEQISTNEKFWERIAKLGDITDMGNFIGFKKRG